jgi:hypothetical protein
MAGNPVMLTYPYAYDFFNSAMLDQAVAGLNYRLIGGQAIVPGSPDSGHHIAPLKPLAVFSVFTCSYFGANDASISFQGRAVCPRPRLTASTIAAFRAFVDVNRVRVIVWQRTGADPMTPRTFLRAAFGEGHRDRHGDLEWWRFPEPHSPPRE